MRLRRDFKLIKSIEQKMQGDEACQNRPFNCR